MQATTQQRIPTFCAICGGHCAAIATVEDGKLVKWEKDKETDLPSLSCPSFKGQANIEIAYSPDRVKYPMKRVGAKGEGKWQRISWDQAIDEISQKLTELKEKYGPECLSASVGEPKHFEFVWVERFMSAFGSPNITTPHHL